MGLLEVEPELVLLQVDLVGLAILTVLVTGLVDHMIIGPAHQPAFARVDPCVA
jgi:hypothetical protein